MRAIANQVAYTDICYRSWKVRPPVLPPVGTTGSTSQRTAAPVCVTPGCFPQPPAIRGYIDRSTYLHAGNSDFRYHDAGNFSIKKPQYAMVATRGTRTVGDRESQS